MHLEDEVLSETLHQHCLHAAPVLAGPRILGGGHLSFRILQALLRLAFQISVLPLGSWMLFPNLSMCPVVFASPLETSGLLLYVL